MPQPASQSGGGKSAGAVCLLSGGLDSALAAKLVLEQGVRVLGVHFVIPFGRRTVRGAPEPVREVTASLGVDVEVVGLGEEYLEVVRNPKHGYGANVNPCIDCHIYMLRNAAEIMRTRGMDFVVTGEVVGQRPMSQRLDTLRRIEKESGLEGYLVRPLSARLLAPTRPEIDGILNREDLLAIRGRSRRELFRLAEQKGVTGYSSPGGGCLLTDPAYARRVRDLLRHHMLTLHNIDLLSIGRHFRLPSGGKLVVGRHERDNDALAEVADNADLLLTTPDVPGPTAVLSGPSSAEDVVLAGRIVARYSDAGLLDRVRVHMARPVGERYVEVNPLDPEAVSELMV